MHEIADQIAGTEPTGSGPAALSMTARPIQDALSLDNHYEMQEGRERMERIEGTISSWRMVIAELAT